MQAQSCSQSCRWRAPQRLTALDPRTGRRLWKYDHQVPQGHKVYLPNRGVAIGNGLIFYGTHDAKLLAINVSTGVLRWSQTVAGLIATITT